MAYRRLNTLRGEGFDYSQPAYYFLTLSIQGRKPVLGGIRNGKIALSPLGEIVERKWKEIPDHYTHAILHAYQVMPDHFHSVLQFAYGNPESVTISRIIKQFKGVVAKEAKSSGLDVSSPLWQRSYWCKAFWMDHELAKIEKYIWDNPISYFEKHGKI